METANQTFINKKYGITVTLDFIKNAYPDPLCTDGMSNHSIQKAVDEAVEELEGYQTIQSSGNVEYIMKDFANMLWADFIKKYPTLSEMDMWFLGELESALLDSGAKYINENT